MDKEQRIDLLKRMNKAVIDNGDEEIWMAWIVYGVPDCPQEEDYEFIASDEDCFKETLELYERLIE